MVVSEGDGLIDGPFPTDPVKEEFGYQTQEALDPSEPPETVSIIGVFLQTKPDLEAVTAVGAEGGVQAEHSVMLPQDPD